MGSVNSSFRLDFLAGGRFGYGTSKSSLSHHALFFTLGIYLMVVLLTTSEKILLICKGVRGRVFLHSPGLLNRTLRYK